MARQHWPSSLFPCEFAVARWGTTRRDGHSPFRVGQGSVLDRVRDKFVHTQCEIGGGFWTHRRIITKDHKPSLNRAFIGQEENPQKSVQGWRGLPRDDDLLRGQNVVESVAQSRDPLPKGG